MSGGQMALRSVGLMAIMALGLTGCGALGVGNTTPASPPQDSTSQPVPAENSSTRAMPISMVPAGPNERTWEELAPTVSDNVVRLQIAGCDGRATSMGSGFVVGPHEIMTAAHVVDNAPTITVSSALGLARARIIDIDFSTDSALLHIDQSFAGPGFTLSSRPLALGRDLAVLGYPLWVNDLRLSTGVVSGLDESVTYPDPDGYTVEHVFVTDAATNGGNSGGPVLDRTGEVVGLVSGGVNWDSEGESRRPVEGLNYIVPASSLATNLASWSGQAPRTVELCDGTVELPDDARLELTVSAEHPDAAGVAQALFLHGESINTGDYEAAWSVFSPEFQQNHPLEDWIPGHETSYWEALDVKDVKGAEGTVTVSADFRTTQDAEYGHDRQTCSDWDRIYVLVLVDGVWRIDSTRGTDPTAC